MKSLDNFSGFTIEKMICNLLYEHQYIEQPNTLMLGKKIVRKILNNKDCHMLYFTEERKLKFQNLDVHVMHDDYDTCIKLGNVNDYSNFLVEEYCQGKINISSENIVYE